MAGERERVARRLRGGVAPKRAVIGFDGFIDEIIHVVDVREGARFTRIPTIARYAERLAAGSGLSTNIEIVPVQQKIGGNGPIFAGALQRHGVALTMAGAFGEEIHPLYGEFVRGGARLVGLTDPGLTEAYEFEDGKIIVSKIEHFREINWERVVERMGVAELAARMEEADLVGMMNWTMVPFMSGIWEGVLAEVVPGLRGLDGKLFFFDLADPEKRSEQEIAHALDILRAYARAGCRVALGLNKKEACELAVVLGIPVGADILGEPLEPLCRALAGRLGLYCVVVHPTDRACCCTAEGYWEVPGPYCARPKLTTGAGDNFNAGFVLGLLQGYAPAESLLCGVYSSGFYVRHARSASTEELAGFLERGAE